MKSCRLSHKTDMTFKGSRLAFSKRPYVMGILNVTPDSFSDGGRFLDKGLSLRRGIEMVREGADIIDVGGESTRPCAREVSAAEEMRRVIPVIRALAGRVKIPISIDTRKAEVARAAIEAGATMINDVSGLHHDPDMAGVAAKSGVALIVMHMKGEPCDMQRRARYKDLVGEIISGLSGSIETAKRAGVKEGKVIIDPGIGFGKTADHNLEILNRLAEFSKLNRPICIGVSRKSFIGKVLGGGDPDSRLSGTLAALAIAVMNGANIVRVHDVAAAREASLVANSILNKKVM